MHLPRITKWLSVALAAAMGLSTGLVSGTPAFAAQKTHAAKTSGKTHKHAKRSHKHAGKANKHAKANRHTRARTSADGKKPASHARGMKAHKHVRHA
jgi:hypothetical protein